MLLIDAAAGSVAGVVDGGAQRLAAPQVAAKAARAQGVLIRTRGDAEQLREGSLQMERARPDVRGNRTERERFVGVGGNELRGFAHVTNRGRRRYARARTAAAAFTEAGDLRRIGGGKKRDRVALRATARTARPAVHARRA